MREAGAMTRNPFMRVARSIRKHGVVSTARMAFQHSVRFFSQPVANTRLYWAEMVHGGVVICDVQGSRMKLDLSDSGISRGLFIRGIHEPHSTRQFREELKPGMVLLEIGANIGYYTLIAMQHIGKEGSTISLEPSPVNVVSLSENLELNEMGGNVKVYPYAAGRKRGRLPLYQLPSGNHSTLIKRDYGKFRPRSVHDVEVLPVDEIVSSERLTIDYFRMDVEGYETEVIEGMVDTLTSPNGPVGGFIEVHSEFLCQGGSSGRAFVERMFELGFRIKTSRFEGKDKVVVTSNSEFYDHPLAEVRFWETFFVRRQEANGGFK